MVEDQEPEFSAHLVAMVLLNLIASCCACDPTKRVSIERLIA